MGGPRCLLYQSCWADALSYKSELRSEGSEPFQAVLAFFKGPRICRSSVLDSGVDRPPHPSSFTPLYPLKPPQPSRLQPATHARAREISPTRVLGLRGTWGNRDVATERRPMEARA